MAGRIFIEFGKYFYNPWIWGFVLGMPLLYFIYLWIIRLTTQPDVVTDGAGPGCLIQILGLFLQAFGIAFILLLLLPILLGTSDQVSWQAVEPLGFVAVRSGLFAMILVTLASFFPYIGPLLGSSPGTETFLLSFLTFRFLSPLYMEAFIGKNTSQFFPPWWMVIILLIFAWLLSRLLTSLVFFIGQKCRLKGIFQEKNYRAWVEGFGPSLDILGGILPFLYYARWVQLSFKGI